MKHRCCFDAIMSRMLLDVRMVLAVSFMRPAASDSVHNANQRGFYCGMSQRLQI